MWVLCVLMMMNGKLVCLPTADSANELYPTFIKCDDQRKKVPVDIRIVLGLQCTKKNNDELVQ